MKPSNDWKKYWDDKSEKATSDFNFDRGGSPRERELEDLSELELINFIDPQPGEVIFDAGCGTGAIMFLLHARVKRITGMDYSEGGVERCRKRIAEHRIENMEVSQGSVTKLPLADQSVDKIICMSVFQYLSDTEINEAMREFARVLKKKGILVMHVKNLSSIYLSTLWVIKRLKLWVGKKTKVEYLRTFGWYERLLRSFGFEMVDYNSFNVFMVDKMPRRLLLFLQRLELKNYRTPLYRLGIIRRRGSDLKLKARLERES